MAVNVYDTVSWGWFGQCLALLFFSCVFLLRSGANRVRTFAVFPEGFRGIRDATC